MTSPTSSLDTFTERRHVVSARVGALLFDTLLIAYGLWCLNFLGTRWGRGVDDAGWLQSASGFLGARPWLLLLTPLLAVLWQAITTSLGQHLHGLRLLDTAGRPASRALRAWRGLLAGVLVAVVLFPAALGVLREQAGRPGDLHYVLSMLLAVAFAALGLFDDGARGVVDRLAGTRIHTGPHTGPVRVRSWWERTNPWIVLLLLVLTFAVGIAITQFRPAELVEGWSTARAFLGELFSPDWSITGQVIEKMIETVFIAMLASALALPFAFVLSFLGARNVTGDSAGGRIVYTVARVIMNVARSVEPLVWVIIFGLWVGIGRPDAGMLALFVHSVAALGKLYSEAIEAIDPGPVEAIQATGASRLQVLRYGIVPQVIPPFLSFTVYRWDINVRMATILGFVGGGGIGAMLLDSQQMAAWPKVGVIIVFITLVVWALDWISSKARQRLT